MTAPMQLLLTFIALLPGKRVDPPPAEPLPEVRPPVTPLVIEYNDSEGVGPVVMQFSACPGHYDSRSHNGPSGIIMMIHSLAKSDQR